MKFFAFEVDAFLGFAFYAPILDQNFDSLLIFWVLGLVYFRILIFVNRIFEAKFGSWYLVIFYILGLV